jgi:hypothetical protein
MLATVLCVASFTPPPTATATSAFTRPPTATATSAFTRRAALLATPALFAAPLAALADKDTKVGYACRGNDDCGVDAQAKRALLATPGSGSAAGIRFGGTYDDPNHPGCTRKIVLAGTNVIVTGTDDVGGKPWKVKGQIYGKALLLDFTPKGGPADVIARWNGLGLVFDDGNVWSKKP